MEKGADRVTPIEKIRAEVEAVRKKHHRRPGKRAVCQKDNYLIPCPTLRLAEDKLKLAEALDLIRTREEWDAEDDIGGRTPGEITERVLSEVAR